MVLAHWSIFWVGLGQLPGACRVHEVPGIARLQQSHWMYLPSPEAGSPPRNRGFLWDVQEAGRGEEVLLLIQCSGKVLVTWKLLRRWKNCFSDESWRTYHHLEDGNLLGLVFSGGLLLVSVGWLWDSLLKLSWCSLTSFGIYAVVLFFLIVWLKYTKKIVKIHK